MNFRDAAIVASVVMLALTATVFMPAHGYDVLLSDPPRWAFDLFVFAFSTWITQFGALTGLMAYANAKKSGDG